MASRLLVSLLAFVLAASAWADDAPSSAAEQGAALLKPFKQGMMGALMEGLAGGPVATIDACRIRAPEIASELSIDGVSMGRSSHRLRNPANRGPDWIEATLEAYLDDPESREPVVVELGDDRVGYIEPIITQPMCVSCHGDGISGQLAAEIERLYPDDEATGFKAGDLRGVFWVEFAR